jgi:hypothetical protein
MHVPGSFSPRFVTVVPAASSLYFRRQQMKGIHLLFAALLVLALAASTSATVSPATGVLTGTATVTWSGGPLTGSNAAFSTGLNDPIPGICGPLMQCETFNLVVNLPATFYTTCPSCGVQITVNWPLLADDLDLYLFDSAGNIMFFSAQIATNSEFIDAGSLPNGTYQVVVSTGTAAANVAYTANAAMIKEPAVPSGRARYTRGKFTFNTPQQLMRPSDPANAGGSLSPDLVLVFDQDVEPRVVHDSLGNLYVAAIQGVPGGNDMWKSIDGGNAWTYLGQPDGAQMLATLGVTGIGVGGGDDDLAVSSTGAVYMDSLWLGNVTQTVSTDGGTTWFNNPAAGNLPVDDRQWIASYGSNVLYETFRQLGDGVTNNTSLWVGKSFDGGHTFPQMSNVTNPVLGIQPGFEGPITVDQNTGYVYAAFEDSTGTQIFLAKSTDGGLTWMVKQVWPGTNPATGASVSAVFPVLAEDAGGGLHIVFGDTRNVFLTSSADGGASWTPPVRVNNGVMNKTAVEPWIITGAKGKVDIFWWGTSHTDRMDSTDPWELQMAQTQNAFAAVPTFALQNVTGVVHINAICTNGLACPGSSRRFAEYFAPDTYLDGNAYIVYPDDLHSNTASGAARTWFVKQTGGPVIK